MGVDYEQQVKLGFAQFAVGDEARREPLQIVLHQVMARLDGRQLAAQLAQKRLAQAPLVGQAGHRRGAIAEYWQVDLGRGRRGRGRQGQGYE